AGRRTACSGSRLRSSSRIRRWLPGRNSTGVSSGGRSGLQDGPAGHTEGRRLLVPVDAGYPDPLGAARPESPRRPASASAFHCGLMVTVDACGEIDLKSGPGSTHGRTGPNDGHGPRPRASGSVDFLLDSARVYVVYGNLTAQLTAGGTHAHRRTRFLARRR